MIIHFGVNDIPYSFQVDLGKTSTGKQRASTTGDVAGILETKYSVMAKFWELHQDEVVQALRKSVEGAFESLLMGAPAAQGSSDAATSEIEAMFQKFLDLKEMDGIVPGVPTKASLVGVSHRFKHPYAKRASRPSFIDTGLYESSFRCWIEV